VVGNTSLMDFQQLQQDGVRGIFMYFALIPAVSYHSLWMHFLPSGQKCNNYATNLVHHPHLLLQ